MTLGDKQRIFTKNTSLLIGYIYVQGYECTFGETYRTSEQAWINSLPKGSELVANTPEGAKVYPDKVGGSGIAKSVHKLRLAIDLNLFKDGAYLTKSEHYEIFGTYWLTLHELNRWGGDWGDGNHFSMEHDGVR